MTGSVLIVGRDGTTYEVKIEATEGFVLGQSRSFRGYRVTYRPEGSRRWQHFSLVDHESWPTDEEVRIGIAEIAERRAFD